MSWSELVCIVCPASCTLRARPGGGGVEVKDAGCIRGVEYARQELTNPVRYVMSVVRVRNGDLPVVPVITNKPVPRDRVPDVMRATANIDLEAPVELGQVILENVCGASLVATRRVRRIEEGAQR